MRRFVLVSLISFISVVALAGNRATKTTTINKNEYSVEKVLIVGQEVSNFPYSTVNFKNDLFEFVSEGESPMIISYSANTGIATIIVNGEISRVKASLKYGKDGHVTLTYGGYTVVLNKVRG